MMRTIKLPAELYNPDGTITDKTRQLVMAHMNMFPPGPCCKSDSRKLEIYSRFISATHSSGTVVKNGEPSLLFDDRVCNLLISQHCTNCGLTWFYDLDAVLGTEHTEQE